MSSDKIEQLCNYLVKNKEKNYPISNELLVDETDFIKNSYLKMLAVVLQQSENITGAQLVIFKRIVAGARADVSVEDYLRMALDIEIGEYVDFVSECKNSILKYRFILDSIIITAVDERREDQIKLIAEFCESLGIEKRELEYLTTMAKAILEISNSGYMDAYEIKVDSIPEQVFNGYMHLVTQGSIFSNANMTIVQSFGTEQVTVETLDKMKALNTPIVKLINVEVDLSAYPLEFNKKTKVIFEGCKFTGGSKYAISFSDCEQVLIQDTSFEQFNAIALNVKHVVKMEIKRCVFRNCIRKYSYADRSEGVHKREGLIYSAAPSKNGDIVINETVFEQCQVWTDYYTDSVIISNINCHAIRCEFIQCQHQQDNWWTQNGNSAVLFTDDSKETACTFKESDKFRRDR